MITIFTEGDCYEDVEIGDFVPSCLMPMALRALMRSETAVFTKGGLASLIKAGNRSGKGETRPLSSILVELSPADGRQPFNYLPGDVVRVFIPGEKEFNAAIYRVNKSNDLFSVTSPEGEILNVTRAQISLKDQP